LKKRDDFRSDPILFPQPPINDGSIAYWFAKRAVSAFSWGVHRVVYWADEVLGWIFVSLFIAGMSGIMKKE
jgi:hypothetical protein